MVDTQHEFLEYMKDICFKTNHDLLGKRLSVRQEFLITYDTVDYLKMIKYCNS